MQWPCNQKQQIWCQFWVSKSLDWKFRTKVSKFQIFFIFLFLCFDQFAQKLFFKMSNFGLMLDIDETRTAFEKILHICFSLATSWTWFNTRWNIYCASPCILTYFTICMTNYLHFFIIGSFGSGKRNSIPTSWTYTWSSVLTAITCFASLFISHPIFRPSKHGMLTYC